MAIYDYHSYKISAMKSSLKKCAVVSNQKKIQNTATFKKLFSREKLFQISLKKKKTRKDAQHCSISEKYKSKVKWGTTLHQSEWPS